MSSQIARGQAQIAGGPAQNDGGQAQNDGGQHKMTGDTVTVPSKPHILHITVLLILNPMRCL